MTDFIDQLVAEGEGRLAEHRRQAHAFMETLQSELREDFTRSLQFMLNEDFSQFSRQLERNITRMRGELARNATNADTTTDLLQTLTRRLSTSRTSTTRQLANSAARITVRELFPESAATAGHSPSRRGALGRTQISGLLLEQLERARRNW